MRDVLIGVARFALELVSAVVYGLGMVLGTVGGWLRTAGDALGRVADDLG